jgi:protein-tyrosine-phosphatase
MSSPRRNILFLCTGNSARSIIAEALVNNLPLSREKFHAYSAGSRPVGRVNPFAIELLESHGFSTQEMRSKSWDEFAKPGAPELDFIITVCDQAAGEECPFWPGQPMTAHWGIPDPAAVNDSDEEKRKAFKDALFVLRRRIELFASLPFETLDRISLHQHIKRIGAE